MQSVLMQSVPTACDIERVFNRSVGARHNTVLQGGAAEPFYRPADEQHRQHCIFYRADYASSCLHELGHWLVAGPARLLLPDWGYWYAPDGRNAEQQQQFEQVEVKPQALEWLLHRACGLHFRVSLDNLAGEAGDGRHFKDAVHAQVCDYVRRGINARAEALYAAFAQAFGGPPDWRQLVLQRGELD